VRTRSSVSITDAAWNGGRPVKRLYRVAPRANTSDRGPIAARSPAICSGAMNEGVPPTPIGPVAVAPGSSPARAMPKSASIGVT
jgi:hypothetical protein